VRVNVEIMIGIICSHNRIQPIAYKFRPSFNSEVKALDIADICSFMGENNQFK
jgi:hypothetical protein